MNSKINSLETLRGFAALFVAFYHYPSESFLYAKNGNLAVYFFFTLSGFVIALNYFNNIKSVKDLLKFQIKRFFRLYPVHIFVLLLILLIQLLKLYIVSNYSLSAANPAFYPERNYNFQEFVKHILLLQSVFNNGYYLSWNSVAWTISTEFYTYLIFAFLVLVLKNKKNYFILISILYVFLFDFFSPYLNKFFHSTFLMCIQYFLTGSIFYFIFSFIKLKLKDIPFTLLLILILLLKYETQFIENNILFSALILCVSLLNQSSFIYKILNLNVLVYFGTISYSFYMIHQVILYVYIQILKLIFKVPFLYSDGITTNTGNNFYDTLIMISYIMLSAFVASLMYKNIELKFRK